MKTLRVLAGLALALQCAGPVQAADTVPNEVQQPGTQPGEISALESPDKCDNCHGGYNTAVEPAYNWRGSMMAHAGRDPIFWATLAVAEQDFDGSGDLCLRCHAPAGWLGGRSTPTDGSGLAAGDSDGVECDLCHKLTNPDDSEHLGVMNTPFIANDPITGEGYYGSGMTSMWGGAAKMGPYDNADARHQFQLSLFHRDRNFCGTCHDVSNPVTGDLAHNSGKVLSPEVVTRSGIPGDPVETKAAFNNPPHRYGVVERTFSEYWSGALSNTLVDEYPALPDDLKSGAVAAVYEAAYDESRHTANYQNPDAPRYYSCQSCHMRAVTGEGANKQGVPVRTDLPLHDLTGANYWMPEAIAYLDDSDKLRLGGGMSTLQLQAMQDGAARALEQLWLAASLSIDGKELKIVNHSGHKLLSGYPEGRRMWLNIRWYDDGGLLIREDGAYGDLQVQLNGGDATVRSLLDLHDPHTTVFEVHMGITQQWASQLLSVGYPAGLVLEYDRMTGAAGLTLGELAATAPDSAAESFHFALNNTVISDNRIPPFDMDYDEAMRRNASPVPPDQYDGQPGGKYRYYATLALSPPAGAVTAAINLMYQPTSWEYIQFLYLANSGSNAFLAEEGTNMLDAWLNTGMAEPVVMASTAWGAAEPPCTLEAPTLLSAQAGDKSVSLSWTGPASPPIAAYALYYDQSGKSQWVATLDCLEGTCTDYTDDGLTNGQTYCYKVTASDGQCESGFSNIMCATPAQPGQVEEASVQIVETGHWVTEGKARGTYPYYEVTSAFLPGDEILFTVQVTDADGGGVPGVEVSMVVSGPETLVLVTAPTDGAGLAQAAWATDAPNKLGLGGTATGDYSVTVSGMGSADYEWDGIASGANFTIEATVILMGAVGNPRGPPMPKHH